MAKRSENDECYVIDLCKDVRWLMEEEIRFNIPRNSPL